MASLGRSSSLRQTDKLQSWFFDASCCVVHHTFFDAIFFPAMAPLALCNTAAAYLLSSSGIGPPNSDSMDRYPTYLDTRSAPPSIRDTPWATVFAIMMVHPRVAHEYIHHARSRNTLLFSVLQLLSGSKMDLIVFHLSTLSSANSTHTQPRSWMGIFGNSHVPPKIRTFRSFIPALPSEWCFTVQSVFEATRDPDVV